MLLYCSREQFMTSRVTVYTQYTFRLNLSYTSWSMSLLPLAWGCIELVKGHYMQLFALGKGHQYYMYNIIQILLEISSIVLLCNIASVANLIQYFKSHMVIPSLLNHLLEPPQAHFRSLRNVARLISPLSRLFQK